MARRGTICFPGRRARVSSDTVKSMRAPIFAQRPGPRVGGRDPTDPGGPSPEVLAAAFAGSSRRDPPADATVLSGGEQKPATARLLITAGPHRGAEFPIVDPWTTLGRAARNAIVIPDISISREHLAVDKRGDAFVLVDRGSGNGTRVNGRWRRRRRLRHGDEIEIGDTTLCFLAPGGVIACATMRVLPRGRQARPSAAPRAAVLAALALAMVLVVAAAFLRRQRLTGEIEAQAQREATHAMALRKLEEGIALVKEGRFAEGRDRLAVAAELGGGDAEIARAVQAAEEDERAAAVQSRVAPAPVAATPAVGAAVAHPTSVRRARDAAANFARPATVSGEREDRRALAARHVLAAGELRGDQDLPRAAAHLRAAVESDPENGEARAGLERIGARAKEIYLQAYMAKDDDPESARSNLQLVVETLPAGDETAMKARHWIGRLAARGAD
jgi:pSer/pThr/pTyr-binding forkhead associated (FHA) protein